MEWLDTVLGVGASAASGGLFGAIVRFVPEIFKLWTAKADRDHEYRMRQLDAQIAREGSEQRIREADNAGYWVAEGKTVDAWREAIIQQGRLTGNKRIDAMNSLVRPLITYWMLALYSVMKFVMFGVACFDENVGAENALPILWGFSDNQMFFGIIGFWFLDRHLSKRAQGV